MSVVLILDDRSQSQASQTGGDMLQRKVRWDMAYFAITDRLMFKAQMSAITPSSTSLRPAQLPDSFHSVQVASVCQINWDPRLSPAKAMPSGLGLEV